MIQEFTSLDDIFENSLHTREMIHQELVRVCKKELESKICFYRFLKNHNHRDNEFKLLQRQIQSLFLIMKLL